ncbi:MAG: Flagellar motor switch protein FliN [Syntrophomonadaceae bacterium]|nr:Flagellar motor switch protein FliN [Bacillota bacterium]
MPELTTSDCKDELEPTEADTVAEIGNISLGAAATALSLLLDRKVTITTPRVSLTTAREFRTNFPVPCVVVSVHYLQGLSGDNVLIITENDAALIAGLMMGDATPPLAQKLDEISLSAVAEAMNQMMGSTATAMSDLFQRSIEISPPEVAHKDLAGEESKINGHLENERLVQISFSLHVEELLDSELIQLLPVDFARQMSAELMALFSAAYPTADAAPSRAEPTAEIAAASEVREQEIKSEPPAFSLQEKQVVTEVQGSVLHLDLIRDISVRVAGIFGRRTLTIKELLHLTGGAVVELDGQVADPVEILANGKLVARGEVVLVGENFGLKITEIVRP